MITPYNAHKVIASILSYKSDLVLLKKTLSEPSFDWDTLVELGSRHLILPTLYIRLKQKSLLDVLPFELKEYLEELTNINRNRNLSLLNDANEISRLFQTHKINHIFLKGMALLSANYFKDAGERMIADIDILVDTKDIDKAYQLLLNNEFDSADESPLHKYIEHKHLPRLIPKEGLAAVEIHRRLFNSRKTNHLLPEDLLLNKQLTNGVYIPSNKDLLQHNILNWQINDKGYYYSRIGFRSAYDSLIILNTHQKLSIKDELKNSYIRSYYLILSIFFEDIDLDSIKTRGLKLKFLKYRLKNQILSTFMDRILNKLLFLNILLNRFYQFIMNKNYRKDVISDQKRIFKLLKKPRI